MQNNTSESMVYSKSIKSISKLIQKIKPQTSTCLFNCIIALYYSSQENNRQFIYTNKICMMHIDIDRKIKNYVIRLYDIDNLSVIVQMQMYYGMGQMFRPLNIKDQAQQTFYVLPIPSQENIQLGILFNDIKTAKQAQSKIKAYSPKYSQLEELIKQKTQQKLKQQKQKKQYGKRVVKQIQYTWNKVIDYMDHGFPYETIEQKLNQNNNQQIKTQILNVTKNGTVKFDRETNQFIAEKPSQEMEEILRQINLSKNSHQNIQNISN